jgi:CRP-like cAMP-binding protein
VPRPIKIPEPVSNRLLAALSPKEYGRLRPHLSEVALTLGELIYSPGEAIRHVYFPNQGMVSLLAAADGRWLEVGLVGSEGVVGIPAFLGRGTAHNRAVVQGEGTAFRMSAEALRRQVGQDGPLPGLIRAYTNSLMAQVSQTAACNSYHGVEGRFARWLLMTQDRLRCDEFRLTQEFVSGMLGVRREAVSGAARALEGAQLFSYVRGQVVIHDRAGLELAACGCYKSLKLEHP